MLYENKDMIIYEGDNMNALLIENIAFIISILAFIYGLVNISKKDVPLYYKLIVNAIGCYALEELWSIINAYCGFENGFISIRLIGIFGCFCTFLTASINGLNNANKEKNNSNKYLSFIAPIITIILFVMYSYKLYDLEINSHIVISFIVLIPLIIDSYFELKGILSNKNNYLKMINILVLFEYAITLSYLFIISTNVKLILDIISAIVMALIIYVCNKGVIKWKTSI